MLCLTVAHENTFVLTPKSDDRKNPTTLPRKFLALKHRKLTKVLHKNCTCNYNSPPSRKDNLH